MKKMLITFILSILFLPCIAPVSHTSNYLYIEVSEPLYIFNMKDPLLRAVAWLESRYNERAVNKVSGARGLLQIMPVMIREVNKICKKTGNPARYTWKDAWDAQKSIEIWWIVQNYHNTEYNIQKACIIWFGKGRQYDGMTWREYLKQIQKRL